MPDHRVAKLAQVLDKYSLDLQTGEEVYVNTSPLAEELCLAVYAEPARLWPPLGYAV